MSRKASGLSSYSPKMLGPGTFEKSVYLGVRLSLGAEVVYTSRTDSRSKHPMPRIGREASGAYWDCQTIGSQGRYQYLRYDKHVRVPFRARHAKSRRVTVQCGKTGRTCSRRIAWELTMKRSLHAYDREWACSTALWLVLFRSRSPCRGQHGVRTGMRPVRHTWLPAGPFPYSCFAILPGPLD